MKAYVSSDQQEKGKQSGKLFYFFDLLSVFSCRFINKIEAYRALELLLNLSDSSPPNGVQLYILLSFCHVINIYIYIKYKSDTFATSKHVVSGTDYIYNADSSPLSGSKPLHLPLTINPTPTSKNM